MIQIQGEGVRRARIVGAGAYVPERAVCNTRIAEAIPGWTPERIEEKIGIRERRFLWDFDAATGRAIAPEAAATATATEAPTCNSDMCEVALRRALEMGGVDARELDAVFLVTCTPDELNFNHDAMELHRRLGCRTDCFALVIDDGCGGTPYMMDMACRMIRGGTFRTIAVVGSAFSSPLMHREVCTDSVEPSPGRKALNAYLSMYVFGDGAGAVVLRGDTSARSGVLASMSGNDHADLVLRRGGGMVNLPYQERIRPADMAFVIDGYQVARSYPVHMALCIESVLADHPELADEVRRYYLHQPNKRLMDRFVADSGLPADRIATNVARYGNTSAAGMLILLAEDLEAGTVALDSGDLVVVAAVGANVHYGAQLVRL
ncbi:MAG TPA: 3-oxoacyl-[acyl-carrier-protein] synthase III C-terminal domain-containing protein [Longimicrobiaceae bacterium]